MESLALDFYGVRVAVFGDDGTVLEDIRRDFEYFSVPAGAPSPEIRVTLRLAAVPRERIPQRKAVLCSAQFAAFDDGPRRVVDYHGKALAVLDFSTETAEVFSEDAALLRELGYLLVCSRAGFGLDLRGLHRAHALGVEAGGRRGLVLLPSGGGKTALALGLIRRRRARILSEDTPLVTRGGTLLPFPLRLGLTPDTDLSEIPVPLRRTMRRRAHGTKILVDLGYFKESLGTEGPAEALVLGRRSGAGSGTASPAFFARAVPALFSGLVAGCGVPQLTEFMWRTDLAGLAALSKVALSRAAAAAALLARCRTYELILGFDRSSNEDALLGLLDQTS